MNHHDVDELLAKLYNMVNDAFTLPLSSDRCFIDKDKALALLDEIIASMPGYLKDAKRIAQDEAQILAKAKRDAEVIRHNAEELAKRLTSEHDILMAAKKKAHDLLSEAEQKDKAIKKSTNSYVDDLLRRTEESINTARNEVIHTRSEFRNAARHKAVSGE
ncbi:MAG: hypothetical protein LBI44_02555 [Oscillospiraceae bacterium]|jgi:cell division septum initiation protein DivIVA|nr:hypothetical protein [Oscillospiraceae bacterium]